MNDINNKDRTNNT